VASRDQSGLGADFFIQNSDAVQDGVYVPIYLTIILPSTQQLARPLERKLAVVSLTKTLADSQAFAIKYVKGWSKTCEALLKLLENPPMPITSDDVVVEVDVDDLSFGVGFTPLNTCKKVAKDEWPEVTDVKSWVGSYLKAADARQAGAIGTYVNERLSPEAKTVLVSYMR
jgi:exportin-2 (importin alpha re-exporter)